jgi:4,5-DOPA dioxygenase extradiol
MMEAQKTFTRMPVLFIGHGSPMNIIMDNDFTRSLVKLGTSLPAPKSILVISAHWLARASLVTCAKNPEQLYDFFGFPPELYRYRYPCPGAPGDAQMVSRITKYMVNCSMEWGLDHASWAVLKHMYPRADIPVFEMSLNAAMDAGYHYELSRRLAPLRREGILIIGSGNIVHNLGIMDYDMEAEPQGWAVDIDEKLRSLLVNGDHSSLVNYEGLGKNMALAAPTNDHYLPMVSALGLQERDDQIYFFHEGIQHGSISMRSFLIG